MDFGIKNKVALAQGASSGLELATALELAAISTFMASTRDNYLTGQSIVVGGDLVKGLF